MVIEKNNLTKVNESQKIMVFILAMALFGLADLITELIPDIKLGPISVGIPYFAFVALTIVMLLNPLYGALGAAFGEMVFGDILMGDFGGIGELEGFLEFFIAMYIAGLIVRNPRDKKQVVLGTIVGVGLDRIMSSIVDLSKIWIGIDKFEAITGLPKSMLLIEGIDTTNKFIVAGIIFGLIPTIYLVPRLYGKIEPLLGIKPRDINNKKSFGDIFTPKILWTSIMLFILGGVLQIVGKMDIEFFKIFELKADYIDKYGTAFVWIGIAICAVIAIAAILYANNKKKKNDNVKGTNI